MMKKAMMFLTILATSTGAMATDNTDGVCTRQQDKSGQCVPKVHENPEDAEGLSLLQQSVVVQKSRKQEKKDLDYLTEEEEDDEVTPNKNDEEMMKDIESAGEPSAAEPDAVVDNHEEITIDGESAGEPDGVANLENNSSLIQKNGDGWTIFIKICYNAGWQVYAPSYCGSAAIREKLFTVHPTPGQKFVRSGAEPKTKKQKSESKPDSQWSAITLRYWSNPGVVKLSMPAGSKGKDAAWIDYFRLSWPTSKGIAKHQVGSHGLKGWCLSTEANDGKYWEDNGYTGHSKCFKAINFDFSRLDNALWGWWAE